MVSPILVGTASWTDKTLIACGRFYPPEAKSAEARLRHYASVFPMVEVDSSYYAMPSPANAQLWAERTPAHFEFNVKAFRLFTGHQTSPEALHKDIRTALGAAPGATLYYRDVPAELRDELWRRFLEALEPLRLAGKLGAIHFQFPPWMQRNRESDAHIEHVVERMGSHTVAVEFRHRSWFDGEAAARTMEFQRRLGVVHTVVDAPPGFYNSVPALWEATHPALGILRLHGRNKATWNQKGFTAASSRFNYEYTDEELAPMVPKLRELSRMVGKLHVVFNTNYEDQGQRQALAMIRLLQAA